MSDLQSEIATVQLVTSGGGIAELLMAWALPVLAYIALHFVVAKVRPLNPPAFNISLAILIFSVSCGFGSIALSLVSQGAASIDRMSQLTNVMWLRVNYDVVCKFDSDKRTPEMLTESEAELRAPTLIWSDVDHANPHALGAGEAIPCSGFVKSTQYPEGRVESMEALARHLMFLGVVMFWITGGTLLVCVVRQLKGNAPQL